VATIVLIFLNINWPNFIIAFRLREVTFKDTQFAYNVTRYNSRMLMNEHRTAQVASDNAIRFKLTNLGREMA